MNPNPSTTPADTSNPSDTRRTWRVGHQGRDSMYYEELHDGAWQRIDIAGEMLVGPAHHAIYFDSPERWQAYPEWARGRRDEIIARIKSEFRPPDYEYHDGAAGRAPAISTSAAPATAKRATVLSGATPKQKLALFVFILILLGITAGMAWLVTSGVSSGTTYFPSKRASQQREVIREQEPATFWLSIGIYSAIGLGAGGMGAWLIRQSIRRTP